MELTDVDPDTVDIGDRVAMTFRKLFTADGIHDYFWKARPVRGRRPGRGRRRCETDIRDRGDGRWHRTGSRTGWPSSGMGCTRFAEHWDKGLDDLIIEAAEDTFASAGVTKDDVDAYWFGTAQSGMSGITLARPLQLEGKPVTRVENYCTTGSEALRAAAYAVASGAYDVAMAVGAEKVKDSGYQGLNAFPIPNDGTARTLTAAAMFSMVAPAYGKKYGVGEDELTEVLARISWKNHQQRGAQPPGPVPQGGLHRDHLRLAAGGRAARGVRLRRGGRRGRRRHRGPGRGRPPLHRQAALHQGPVLLRRQRLGPHRPRLRLHLVPRVRPGRRGRLRPGRHHRSPPPAGHGRGARLLHPDRAGPDGGPRASPSGARRGRRCWPAPSTATGELPVNPDGGLKSFGHPVGASGLRMFFETWLQLRGEATPERQIAHRPDAGPHPQPGRLPGRDGLVRVSGGNRARLSPDAVGLGARRAGPPGVGARRAALADLVGVGAEQG